MVSDFFCWLQPFGLEIFPHLRLCIFDNFHGERPGAHDDTDHRSSADSINSVVHRATVRITIAGQTSGKLTNTQNRRSNISIGYTNTWDVAFATHSSQHPFELHTHGWVQGRYNWGRLLQKMARNAATSAQETRLGLQR